MVVGILKHIKNLDFPLNLTLDESDIEVSTKNRNLGVVFVESLILKN